MADDNGKLELDENNPELPEHDNANGSVRRSSRQRKVNPIHAGYLNDIRIKRLKSELEHNAQEIDSLLKTLCVDPSSRDPSEMRRDFDKLAVVLKAYIRTYAEYSEITSYTEELQRLQLERQRFERRIQDCNQLVTRQLHDTICEDKGGRRQDDVKSGISGFTKSTHTSKRSSTSSKARAAERNAQLAKLKLNSSKRRKG
jgi:hypothetical protein